MDGILKSQQGILNLKPGQYVFCEEELWLIVSTIDLEHVLAENQNTGLLKKLDVRSLTMANKDELKSNSRDLALISDEDWEIAEERFDAIKPLLRDTPPSKEEIESSAKCMRVNPSTIYRWAANYRKYHRVSALAPTRSRSSRGQSRLDDEVEEVVQQVIEEKYLSNQRLTATATAEEVRFRCKKLELQPPHPNTIRNRIRDLSERKKLAQRHSRKLAREKYEPILGAFNDAKHPLSIIQIDHTPVDLILVDDTDRQPIGRPWITVAIDVFSRTIAGFYISLDPPSSHSVGMCLTHAILPKDVWLDKKKINAQWPIWGIPQIVHADNAKEFRGKVLQKACKEYGIDLHWRPVGRSHFGGHIERLLGTFSKRIHTLPGTTFSNVKEKGDYPSTKESALTLEEFENWLTIFITKHYHVDLHSVIKTTPLAKYESAILGNGDSLGVGLPEIITNPERLKIDFLPFEERTVQKYGILLDHIVYYHDVLRPWIQALEGSSKHKKRKFLIRRDPRDISIIYFYDPEVEEYFEIPYRDTSHPPMSVWELKRIQRNIVETGKKEVDEVSIFEAYEEMQEIQAKAKTTTLKKRRESQRKKEHSKAISSKPYKPNQSDDWLELEEDIQPFDEIDIGD